MTYFMRLDQKSANFFYKGTESRYFIFKILFIYLFIYFLLHWVFVAARRLLTAVASLVVEHGL